MRSVRLLLQNNEKGEKMEKINILQIILSYLLPTILGGIVGFISAKLKKNKKKDKAIEEGVQALLRNEIIRRYREFESKGEISILDQENLEEMFIQYQNLGGNGTVKKMMNDLYELKTKIIRWKGDFIWNRLGMI